MNDVSIIGMLREGVDEYYRYFEYELPFFTDTESLPTRIAIKYWTKQANPRLIVLPSNTRVAIHGHLDAHKNFGTILVVEQFQVIK